MLSIEFLELNPQDMINTNEYDSELEFWIAELYSYMLYMVVHISMHLIISQQTYAGVRIWVETMSTGYLFWQ